MLGAGAAVERRQCCVGRTAAHLDNTVYIVYYMTVGVSDTILYGS